MKFKTRQKRKLKIVNKKIRKNLKKINYKKVVLFYIKT
jgi:hypothetical protein